MIFVTRRRRERKREDGERKRGIGKLEVIGKSRNGIGGKRERDMEN